MNLILSKRSIQLICALLVVVLCGCAREPIPTPEMREQTANSLARMAGWQLDTINTSNFALATYLPKKIEKNKTLTVYIEGDGFPFQTGSIVSNNPTPIKPLALELALEHPAHFGAAAYLARPCQYVSGRYRKTCSELDWTNQRFSLKVIESTNQAVDELKKRFDASELILVGYSGGGAVATLVAAERTDVVRLVTVAGNLDIDYWATKVPRIDKWGPLKGSLNPADQWAKLVSIPQLHLVGENDDSVKPTVAYSYAKHFPANQQPTIKVIPDFDHFCCWVRDWPTLFK